MVNETKTRIARLMGENFDFPIFWLYSIETCMPVTSALTGMHIYQAYVLVACPIYLQHSLDYYRSVLRDSLDLSSRSYAYLGRISCVLE